MPKQSTYCIDCEGECHHLHAPIKGANQQRPYRSPGFSTATPGKRLSDKKIEAYRKLGYYNGGLLDLQRKEKITKSKIKKKHKKLSLAQFL